MLRMFRFLFVLIAVIAFSPFVSAQNKIPAPAEVLGFTPGDDRKLASWAQVLDYFQKLDAASDRVKFEELGKSTNGNPFVTAYISAPENLANLKKYQEINQKLADPRLIKSNDAAAKQLIKNGKTIVLITCGIHSNEVGSYLSSILMAHKLATATDAKTAKILKETIVILVPSLNPDGVDIIKNWYDKTLGTPYEGTEPPELYAKYVGHDNNRDWYAFTQKETQITVDEIHNKWRPQIVHDIHQMGAFGARIWLPPYMKPVEPNVPKQIVEGYTELGKAMMTEMHNQNFVGIANDSIFDAWTPARAYSHYHGGVRILSETASAKLATPRTVKPDELRAGIGYDPKKTSTNFPKIWNGGEWKLRDITDYMTTAAFALMNHAADNREKWLTNFYQIGKEAIRPRKNGETAAYILDDESRFSWFLRDVLDKAGVEFKSVGKFTYNGTEYPDHTDIIPANQPYFAFAKTLIESQKYPDLRDEKNQPIAPYDVTAHSLALLTGTKLIKVSAPFKFSKPPLTGYGEGTSSGYGCGGLDLPSRWIYRSYVSSMDEGWTRFVYEKYNYLAENWARCQPVFKSAIDADLQSGNFRGAKSILFPDQAAVQMLNGHAKGTMPDEYTGGIGKDGAASLRKFAENGGTLIFLNRAAQFAIDEFNLPVRDVTKGLDKKEFYIPGSILRTNLDTAHPIARRMNADSIAWFENSPAFEVEPNADVKIIAKYPNDPKDILLSGWALGAEKIAGKAALVEIPIGKGKIILFGFRPQYRGQSLATFPLLFNAVTNK